MSERVAGSMRTRQSLSNLIEGRLSLRNGRAEPVKLESRLIVEEALEAESRDVLERTNCEHGAEPGRTARGFSSEGRKVLLRLMAGSKEDAGTGSAFFRDMRARGLGDPLLVVWDGAPGIVKTIEPCVPRSERQRCLAHRVRNLAAKVGRDQWPEFIVRVMVAYQAPSRAIARKAAGGIRVDYEVRRSSAVAWLPDRLEGLHRASAGAGPPPAGQSGQRIVSGGCSSRNGNDSRSSTTPSARGRSSSSCSAP